MIPTEAEFAAEMDALYATAPLLDTSSQDMRVVCGRYVEHRLDQAGLQSLCES